MLGALDIVIIVVVAILFLLAVVYIVRRGGTGCSGNCENCRMSHSKRLKSECKKESDSKRN